MGSRASRSAMAAVAAASVVLAVVMLMPRRPRLSEAAFLRVRVGMTVQEVVEIVVAPPGIYAAGEQGSDFGLMNNPELDSGKCSQWVCDEAELLVAYSEGRAAQIELLPGLRLRPSLWERFRRWVGR